MLPQHLNTKITGMMYKMMHQHINLKRLFSETDHPTMLQPKLPKYAF